MPKVNLIPAHRLAARRRRGRWRVWALAGIAYGAALGLACIGAQNHWQRDLPGAQRQLTEAKRQATAIETELKTARIRLVRANARLETVEAIADHPDWSRLLALLAGQLSDDQVLASIRLAPVSAAGGNSTGRYQLELQGRAGSHAAVSQLVGRLQDHPLFRDVRLLRSFRESAGESEAVSFQVQCALGE